MVVEGQVFVHYDSNSRREQPRVSWIKKVEKEDPQYWDTQTQILRNIEEAFRGNLETLRLRYNQSEGGEMPALAEDTSGQVRNGLLPLGLLSPFPLSLRFAAPPAPKRSGRSCEGAVPETKAESSVAGDPTQSPVRAREGEARNQKPACKG
ncbi:HLA class I histocompatibility antigen B-38 alpha chain-like [Crotalus adamanteus]|uniref:HLA class I histocompatibility antigen B-38 alpha chain-like n=1 Tax=Crotalus adamanteus TaxID=8729 RepID=A0AAW1BIE5_CROAD